MIRVTVKGLDAAVKRLSPAALGKPVRRFLERAGEEVLGAEKDRSPIDEGRLVTSLGHGSPEGIWDMDSGQMPKSLWIGTNVQHEGFPYPAALDASPRYHYRGKAHAAAGGRGRSALFGKPTKGWFTEAAETVRDKIEGHVRRLGQEIEEALRG